MALFILFQVGVTRWDGVSFLRLEPDNTQWIPNKNGINQYKSYAKIMHVMDIVWAFNHYIPSGKRLQKAMENHWF